MRIIAEAPKAASQGTNWQFIITIVLIALVFFLFRRMSRKAAAKQEEARNEWFVVGTNVVTTSGFLGTIVDIDGDAVTLESPSGDETVWLKAAINRPMDLPLEPVSEEESLAQEETQVDETPKSVSDTDTEEAPQA